MKWISFAGVLLMGIYLCSLAVVSVVRPKSAAKFLNSFAQSAPIHYVELGIRVVAGIALVSSAPHMRFTRTIEFFGWILLITTLLLFLLPWRWHQKFATRVIPMVVQHLTLFAFASLLMGLSLLFALGQPLVV